MSKGIRFTDEFKKGAGAQVVDREYAINEVEKRLGISKKIIVHMEGAVYEAGASAC
jgi:hypothetical protein